MKSKGLNANFFAFIDKYVSERCIFVRVRALRSVINLAFEL
jgi:hypothetical protein